MNQPVNGFHARSKLKIENREYTIFRLDQLKKEGAGDPGRLPFSLRILLENLLRCEDGNFVKREDILALLRWNPKSKPEKEISFTPSRVLLQDFTGVPLVVDLAAMRDAIQKMGGNPEKVNPLIPLELVIDHSVQVDQFGSPGAFQENARLEFERNFERYEFLKWGQSALRDFWVVPPETGIVHQVNLEYLAKVVYEKNIVVNERLNETLLYPDTLVGTDSHTTMINGLGVVGWGVGGIEAEAAMLGQPISMLIPEVVGFKLYGKLREGVTATDLVLTVTQILRKKGVVGKFVEFFGSGLDSLSLPDRATVANMAPEYGATIGFFPVDQETLNYLRLSGRSEELVKKVEAYTKEQGLFRMKETPDPIFSDVLELDLSTIEPSLAGPKRPQDRVSLSGVRKSFFDSFQSMIGEKKSGGAVATMAEVDHGSVVIAAITSCTNTSNPSVMIGAGLLAKKAVEQGLAVKPWVKTSLAPGSKVVMEYLRAAKLLEFLEKLKFHLVGFGCTTCIGNSGPLPEAIGKQVKERNLAVAAVLSGNRNFEGRINSLVRANYLASPPLVVAYAIAGTVDINFENEALGTNSVGKEIYLRDIWPSQKEIGEAMRTITSQMFGQQYADVYKGNEQWRKLKGAHGVTFPWNEKSTYVKYPPYFENMPKVPAPVQDIKSARALVVVSDSVTTDHISPAGSIAEDSPAGKYLIERGIPKKDFNSYGARRGNHEVMMRGTFANVRLKNLLVPETEGPWTKYVPTAEKMFIFDAAMKYEQKKIPLIVIAGKEYGSGSSRDWAAKGPALLGVKAVIAESFERIHRSNLIGMGILPIEFNPGDSREKLSLTGEEEFGISGVADQLKPRKQLTIVAKGKAGERKFNGICRIDTPAELEYYKHGGILQFVLRRMLR